VEAHGHAADDDEVNVRSLERLDEYPGLKVGRQRSTEPRNCFIPRDALAR
jgi:hypothetical protein